MINSIKNEKGNVFFIVMVGIVLFAALVYTFTKSSQNSSGNLSKAEAKIYASDIISYARNLEKSVNKVLRNGCSEVDISFDNEIISGYSHSSSVNDECKIFNVTGGNLRYMIPYVSWLDISSAQSMASPWYGEWLFTGSSFVTGTGNDNNDLIAILAYVNRDICKAINDIVGITNIAGELTKDVGIAYDYDKYTGSYSGSDSINNDLNENLKAKMYGCIEGGSSFSTSKGQMSDSYAYYHVLIER